MLNEFAFSDWIHSINNHMLDVIVYNKFHIKWIHSVYYLNPLMRFLPLASKAALMCSNFSVSDTKSYTR